MQAMSPVNETSQAPAQDRLYFRQLLAGRDIATSDPLARQMVNFVYLIGDRETGEAVVIDPAYDIKGILDVLAADGMRLVGALATHYHPDHVGGDMMGYQIAGVRELLVLDPVPVHVQADEAPWVQRVTEASATDLVEHTSGDTVMVGDIPIELIHTPGHTPGSQCFLVDNRLVAGDTLFLEGCGRTDLPGGDPSALYESLTQRLAKVPDEAVLFPGHLYSAESSASMGETRRLNFVFQPRNVQEWLRMFGAA
jgi:glyoxylase-like metal-dependent hydrolase (beta-lactamase superfamily II)